MELVLQHVFNGLMLGVIYALVATGFSLFFGVLDVVKFSHGDVVTAGAFAGLGASGLAITALGASHWAALACGAAGAVAAGALIGAAVGRFIALPLRKAPAVNVLLATLMAGTAIRELIRVGLPNGGNPRPFPTLLPTTLMGFGDFRVGTDSILILAAGLLLILGTSALIRKTSLGLSIRAVAQDPDTARLSGIDFDKTVMLTFALGSALAAVAGVMIGLYYREITFSMGILLGIVGFASAVVGGLGNILGAALGGFLFAGIQTVASVAMPFSSAYKDVVTFGVLVLLMSLFPTGLLAEKASDRV